MFTDMDYELEEDKLWVSGTASIKNLENINV